MKSNSLKGFISGVIVTSIVSLSMSAFADSIEKQISVAYNNIKVSVGGQEVTLKDASGNTVEPFSYNGTVYLPVRAISNALGCTVSWDETTKTVKLQAASNSQGTGESAGAAINKANSSDMKEKLQNALSSLVSSGTLTQKKADKVLTYFSDNGAEQSSAAEPAKGTAMKAEPLSQAVTDGVITQDEADAIKKVIMPEGGQKGPGNGNAPGANSSSN